MGTICSTDEFFCGGRDNNDSKDISKIDMNQRRKSIPKTETKKPHEIKTENEWDDPMNSDIFGVDQDTMRVILSLENISPLNDKKTIPSFDIDIDSDNNHESSSKEESVPFINVSPKITNVQQLLPKKSIENLNLSPINIQNLSTLNHLSMMEKYAVSESLTDDSSYSEQEKFEIQRLKSPQNHKRKKSNLIRKKSNDEWESEDIDDLEHEMKREFHRLSTLSPSTPNNQISIETLITPKYRDTDIQSDDEGFHNIQNLNDTPANLIRLKSSHKWQSFEIDAQKNEMAKHMIHLASNYSVNSEIADIQ